jgi:hypothetical protein
MFRGEEARAFNYLPGGIALNAAVSPIECRKTNAASRKGRRLRAALP